MEKICVVMLLFGGLAIANDITQHFNSSSNSVTLECPFPSLSPDYPVFWYKEDKALNYIPGKYVIINSSLTQFSPAKLLIENITLKDEGRYKSNCGSPSKNYTAEVTVHPVPILDVDNSHVIQPNNYTIIGCNAAFGILGKDKSQITLAALVDDTRRVVSTEPVYQPNIDNSSFVPQFNLTYEKALDFNSTQFNCQACPHDMGNTCDDIVHNVSLLPDVSISSDKLIEAQKGDVINITCESQHPRLQNIRWMKGNGNTIASNGPTLKVILTNSTTGRYICEVQADNLISKETVIIDIKQVSPSVIPTSTITKSTISVPGTAVTPSSSIPSTVNTNVIILTLSAATIVVVFICLFFIIFILWFGLVYFYKCKRTSKGTDDGPVNNNNIQSIAASYENSSFTIDSSSLSTNRSPHWQTTTDTTSFSRSNCHSCITTPSCQSHYYQCHHCHHHCHSQQVPPPEHHCCCQYITSCHHCRPYPVRDNASMISGDTGRGTLNKNISNETVTSSDSSCVSSGYGNGYTINPHRTNLQRYSNDAVFV